MYNVFMHMMQSLPPVLVSYFAVYFFSKSAIKSKMKLIIHVVVFLLVWIIASFPYFLYGGMPYVNPALTMAVPAGIAALFIVPILLSERGKKAK